MPSVRLTDLQVFEVQHLEMAWLVGGGGASIVYALSAILYTAIVDGVRFVFQRGRHVQFFSSFVRAGETATTAFVHVQPFCVHVFQVCIQYATAVLTNLGVKIFWLDC